MSGLAASGPPTCDGTEQAAASGSLEPEVLSLENRDMESRDMESHGLDRHGLERHGQARHGLQKHGPDGQAPERIKSGNQATGVHGPDSHPPDKHQPDSHQRDSQQPGRPIAERHPPQILDSACRPASSPSLERFGERVRQRFGRRAADYEGEARLQQAIAWRLARCGGDLPLPHGPRADLGAGTGLLSRALQQHHPQLRDGAPLQLDLCPDLLARNALASPAVAAGRIASDSPPATGPRARADSLQERPNRHSNATTKDATNDDANSLVWDLNNGLPADLQGAALLASSFALQWLDQPARELGRWCRSLSPGGWLLLAVPTSGSFQQWQNAAERAGVPCTALALPSADALLQAAASNGLSLRQVQRLRFSRPRQGGLRTLRHLQRLGASASRRGPLTPSQLRRLLRHWPEHTPLTWEVLLLIGQRAAA